MPFPFECDLIHDAPPFENAGFDAAGTHQA